METVSTIIVTWNNSKTIRNCLSSVFNSASEGEAGVIVVDNASSDATVAEIEKNFPQVKLITNKENLGFAKANNQGSKLARGKYLLLLNPDAVLAPGALDKMVEYLEVNSQVAVVGPMLVNSDGSLQSERGKFPTFLSQILILLRLHRLSWISGLVYEKNTPVVGEAEHLMGAALLLRKSVFDEVGGFDEKFFLWFEETDLLKRIKDGGYKIIYYPDSKVTHLIGQSTKQIDFLKKQNIWNKSLMYYFKKHHNWLILVMLLPFIALSYLTASVRFLKTRSKS